MIQKNRDQIYQDLLDNYGEEKLKKRFLFLYKACNTFIKDRNINDICGINIKALHDIVTDYFADILRLKSFHNIELSHIDKVAAYLSYWCNKRKPLYLYTKPSKEQVLECPSLHDVNEWFCSALITSILYIKNGNVVVVPGNKYNYRNFTELLIYNFVYRVVTPQSIELAIVGLKTEEAFLRN